MNAKHGARLARFSPEPGSPGRAMGGIDELLRRWRAEEAQLLRAQRDARAATWARLRWAALVLLLLAVAATSVAVVLSV